MKINTINSYSPSQKKAINSFNKLLQDKDIVGVELQEGRYVIEYQNGQKLKCKGVVVNASKIFEKPKQIKKRLF